MIILAFIRLIMTLIFNIVGTVDIPDLPPDIVDNVTWIVAVIRTGWNLIDWFIPIDFMLSLLVWYYGLVLAFKVFGLIVWVIERIPVLGAKIGS